MIDVNELKNYIPHRFPFLLVDRVLEVEKSKRVVGIKNVSANEHFFEGHFPGNPIMPGVLIIEALAQTAGILTNVSADKKFKGVYFMSIEKAKFRKPVVPGDQLRLEVELVKQRNTVLKFSGLAKVDDKVVAEADFTAMMTDMEE
ncbi:MAG: 3-hydroxyacyl-ACP dehydratase FabZ [Nitrospirota bacterium]|jgi:3-hydroxyacyl-[acyl-carrier-protein] dehydratase